MGSRTNISNGRSQIIRILAGFAPPLGFAVDKDGRSAFGHEEMDRLRGNAKDKLNPEVPIPAEICIPLA
jgi:hypothetical protein